MGDPTRYQSRHLLFEILYFTIEIRYLFAGIHHSAQFIFEYFSLYMMFCKNVVLHGHFVICIRPCLGWIDVASVKHSLNATKAAQSALNARKPLVGGWGPHLCFGPSGSSFCPLSLAPIGIRHLLLSNLTTAYRRTLVWTAVTDIGFHRVWSNVRRPRR